MHSQHCLQCRWRPSDLNWGYCRTIEEIFCGAPQSHFAEGAKDRDSEVDSAVTQVKAAEVVSKPFSGKDSGVDEICLEYLKFLVVVVLSWLTHVCNITWHSETGRPEWWYLFLKCGTRGCVPTLRSSHFSASLDRSMPGYQKGEFGQ